MSTRVKTSAKVRTARPASLRQELRRLRSLMIGLAGTDDEGSYRPEFVRRALEASAEPPAQTFHDAKSFLKQLRSV